MARHLAAVEIKGWHIRCNSPKFTIFGQTARIRVFWGHFNVVSAVEGSITHTACFTLTITVRPDLCSVGLLLSIITVDRFFAAPLTNREHLSNLARFNVGER
jgi:hypothetical protein